MTHASFPSDTQSSVSRWTAINGWICSKRACDKLKQELRSQKVLLLLINYDVISRSVHPTSRIQQRAACNNLVKSSFSLQIKEAAEGSGSSASGSKNTNHLVSVSLSCWRATSEQTQNLLPWFHWTSGDVDQKHEVAAFVIALVGLKGGLEQFTYFLWQKNFPPVTKYEFHYGKMKLSHRDVNALCCSRPSWTSDIPNVSHRWWRQPMTGNHSLELDDDLKQICQLEIMKPKYRDPL